MSAKKKNYINYATGTVDITLPAITGGPMDAAYDFIIGEPSAVDRLAAIEDPDGEAAQRIAEWKKGKETLAAIAKASNEIYKTTKRGSNWLHVSRKTALDMGLNPDDLEEIDPDATHQVRPDVVC